MLKLYTTGQLAKRWGKCRESINYYIKIGRLKPSTIVQNRAFFTEEAIIEFEREQQKGSPEAKAA